MPGKVPNALNNIRVILAVAMLLALLLALGVYYFVDEETGYYFALLIALPAGLAGAGMIWLVVSALSPGRRRDE